jgi:hypothetical protein
MAAAKGFFRNILEFLHYFTEEIVTVTKQTALTAVNPAPVCLRLSQKKANVRWPSWCEHLPEQVPKIGPRLAPQAVSPDY